MGKSVIERSTDRRPPNGEAARITVGAVRYSLTLTVI